jgi:quercetin dioxygenase-like cupin family protein
MKYIINEDNVEVKDLPGRSLRWLITPEMKLTDNFSVNVVVINPGNTVKPAHAHTNKEELIYITSGKGKVFIDGSVYEIRQGTSVLFKPGSVHMVRNDGEEDMKIVCVFSPPATLDDYVFYEDVEFPEIK